MLSILDVLQRNVFTTSSSGMYHIKSNGAMNTRNRQHHPRVSDGFHCGCMPALFDLLAPRRSRRRTVRTPSPVDDKEVETPITRLSMEPVIPVVGASLMTVTRSTFTAEAVEEYIPSAQSRHQSSAGSPKAIGIDLMYRDVAGGEIKAPKSAYCGRHEGWRNPEGAKPPVQGHFRKAYPDYDEDS